MLRTPLKRSACGPGAGRECAPDPAGGGADGAPRPGCPRGRDALTPSELRAAEMAAAGQTNREIAQRLFVTQKTVEAHLGRAFRKLDIDSRAQLAGALSH